MDRSISHAGRFPWNLINSSHSRRPKSLFHSCFLKIWSFKKFKGCSCTNFQSEFSCEYCYKTLVTMQNEFFNINALINDDSIDKHSTFTVDTFECNPIDDFPCYEHSLRKHAGNYTHTFEYVKFNLKNLSMLKKFIILHCLFQHNILKKIAHPEYLYSMTFSMKENSYRWRIRYGDNFWWRYRFPISCASFIKHSYLLLLQNEASEQRDPYEFVISIVKSKNTKHHMLNKNNFFQNVLIGFYSILTIALFLTGLICIINLYAKMFS